MRTNLIKVAVLTLGIYVSFLSQGLLQESLYGVSSGFRYPLFAVSFVCLFSFVVGLLLIRFVDGGTALATAVAEGGQKQRSREILKQGCLTSLSYIGAMAATNFALTHVSYPTQVLVKSAKAVPVVLGSWLMYGKVYPVTDYIVRTLGDRYFVSQMVGVLTGSLVIFQWAHETMSSSGRETGLIGIGALAVALLCDGMTGPRQDRLGERFNLTSGEIMTLINLFAVPVGFVASLLIEGARPWGDLQSRGLEIVPKLLGFVLCGAIGQIFIVKTLKELGSLHLTLITTSRKFLAILLSVFWFRHKLSPIQWVSIFITFSSVTLKYVASRPQTKVVRGTPS